MTGNHTEPMNGAKAPGPLVAVCWAYRERRYRHKHSSWGALSSEQQVNSGHADPTMDLQTGYHDT